MALMTLASLDELPEGGQLRVELDDLTLLLCHLDGTVYAIDYFCTHDEFLQPYFYKICTGDGSHQDNVLCNVLSQRQNI